MIQYGIENFSVQEFIKHIVSTSFQNHLHGNIKIVLAEPSVFETLVLSNAFSVGEIDIIERLEVVLVEDLNELNGFLDSFESGSSEVCLIAIHNVVKTLVDQTETGGFDVLTGRDLNELFFSLKTLLISRRLQVYISDACDDEPCSDEPVIWNRMIPSFRRDDSPNICVGLVVSKWSEPSHIPGGKY